MTTYTVKLSDAQSKELAAILRGQGYEFDSKPHAKFSASHANVRVVMYESGKLVVQGKGTQEFVEFLLEPLILKEARLGYEEVLNPDLLKPRIGIDESGKGDFFGPLCVAAVYVNAECIKALQAANVRDSKQISSDQSIAKLAKVIRTTPGVVHGVVPIGNEAYNRLYAKIGNVNKLLAWGHARALENLLGQAHRMQPPPQRAISDQFARDKAVIERALMKLGRSIELVQRHKAESDLAVAAASILARDEFVTRLKRLGAEYEVQLPKGASAAVIQAGREFAAKHGPEKLVFVAKTHFKTMDSCRSTAPPSPE